MCFSKDLFLNIMRSRMKISVMKVALKFLKIGFGTNAEAQRTRD